MLIMSVLLLTSCISSHQKESEIQYVYVDKYRFLEWESVPDPLRADGTSRVSISGDNVIIEYSYWIELMDYIIATETNIDIIQYSTVNEPLEKIEPSHLSNLCH